MYRINIGSLKRYDNETDLVVDHLLIRLRAVEEREEPDNVGVLLEQR